MDFDFEEEKTPIIMTTPLFNGDRYSDLPVGDIIMIQKDFEILGEKWAEKHAWFLREFKKPSNQNNFDLVDDYEAFTEEKEALKKETKRINKEVDEEMKKRKAFSRYIRSEAYLEDFLFEEEEDEEKFDIFKYSKPVPESWGLLEAPQMASWVDGDDFGIFLNNRAIWFGNIECDVYNPWYDQIKHLFNPNDLYVVGPHS